MGPDDIELEGEAQSGRTFLLGNDAGFVLYLPVEQDVRDRTLEPIKWFGASGFGRKFLEAIEVGLDEGNTADELNRRDQTRFVQHLCGVERTFHLGNVGVTESYFVPDRRQAAILTLTTDRPAGLVLQPEFDMRYYQAFNSDFTGYGAAATENALSVSNRIQGPKDVGTMEFYAWIEAIEGEIAVELLPESERLHRKTYLKDEARAKLIQGAYAETHVQAPDEAPIWDTYSTQVYVPARLRATAPVTLVLAFGDEINDVRETAAAVRRAGATRLRKRKEREVERRLQQARLQTGRDDIDRAYAQVLTRFDTALVARDVDVKTGNVHLQHWSAIFAGNKYFLDAWKRDENISLGGLLATNDYTTVRAILNETWQYQDQRTGRLPHIIRLGEPLVYFSSDGTLWALRRLWEYTRQSGDGTLLDDKYSMVEHFFSASLNFVQRGLLPSGGIIDKRYLWETWEDTPYTPRNGYPVEIEILWLTAIRNYLPAIKAHNPQLAERLEATLQEGNRTFELFYQDGYLADSLTPRWQPRTELTPNGYIAFGVDYPLPPQLAVKMVQLGRAQLAGSRGIRSLAPRDWARVLSPEFLADPHHVHGMDMTSVGIYNYHRGIEWLWLNQFFVEGELAYGSTDDAFACYVAGPLESTLHQAGVGGLSELNDWRGPLGADFQAWSMTSFLVSLRAFAGMTVDAVERRVRIRPSLPSSWPSMTVRRQVGGTGFLVTAEGTSGLTVTIHAERDLSDHHLDVGARVPPGKQPVAVTLNGKPVPRGEWTEQAGDVPGMPGEVWIGLPFGRRTVVRFEMK